MTVAPNVTTQAWYTPGDQPGNKGAEPFAAWLETLSKTPDDAIPQVFSISYADDENEVDKAYASRVCLEFQKAGARGVSVLVASGDFGVGGNTMQDCVEFVPTFPASCPWVTAVGGTWFQRPEQGAQFSGGGFSNYFPQPSYQKTSVASFLQESAGAGKLPSDTLFNKPGRAFPDVSAQGANFPLFHGGEDDSAYGTSCSTPVVASIVALLNDARVAQGKAPLGFLNPLLYQTPNGFTDILEGNNPGCGSKGFYAAKGWDPVTGMGTPVFSTLSDIALELP